MDISVLEFTDIGKYMWIFYIGKVKFFKIHENI